MKRVLVSSSLMLVGYLMTGCTSHHFVNKTGQTEQQYIQDKAYCQGLASGQQSLTNTEGERLIPYEECMRRLGYQPE
ncbi:hypothetical protein QCB45_07735 [Thiomicrorhabdus sp. ZW0627]|uniref:hypothetical protein n=1 Tax=Thiomicrorhabdus sp. ZW0627 TaxID=3039774 RepID=UPI00243719B6|nr:hypothetical protein [Thiomicrorhabdus sp. ZW0627]MDG6774220.1 hypothetical protein [Thiomicrorhabdus sp. ZW0627]